MERPGPARSRRADHLLVQGDNLVRLETRGVWLGAESFALGEVQAAAADARRLVVVHRNGSDVTATIFGDDGRREVRLILSGRSFGAAVLAGDAIWVAQPDRDMVGRHVLDGSSAGPTAKVTLQRGDASDLAPAPDGGLFVGHNHSLRRYSPEGGEPRELSWPDPSPIERLAAGPDRLWLATASGRIVALPFDGGEALAQGRLGDQPVALAVDGSAVFVATGSRESRDQARLHRLNADGSVAWSTAPFPLEDPGEDRALVVVGGDVVFGGAIAHRRWDAISGAPR